MKVPNSDGILDLLTLIFDKKIHICRDPLTLLVF